MNRPGATWVRRARPTAAYRVVGAGEQTPPTRYAVGKVVYGAAFTVAIPALLIGWAAMLSRRVPGLPQVHWPVIGAVAAALGAALMGAGMRALWVYGGGLPMNAFPPARHVIRSVYAVVPHPIYAGFVLACAGASLWAGSAGGLWVVTPVAALGCAALVLGYEAHDLRRRFGAARPGTLLRLPDDSGAHPGTADVASVYVLVLLPWLIAYETLGHATNAAGVPMFLPFERRWPVVEWTEWVYASVYLVAVLVPMMARRRADLRRFCIAGWVGTGVGHLLYFVLPFVAPPRAFEAATWAGRLLMMERAEGVEGRAAFPSFHVFWAVLAAWLIARSRPRWAAAAWVWAAALSVSCVTTGMHAIADVAAGAVMGAACLAAPELWSLAEQGAERVANSWRDWRIGPVRVINHGAYAGLGAFIGVAGAGMLLPAREGVLVALVSLCALVGAGLWGQALVGSRTLLRPFGYYGSVLGAAVGLGLAAALGASFWPIAGALTVVAPWVQAAGRLRCLVQGCCHGAPSGGSVGICYHHPLSRVTRIAHLNGVPLHPTPLYSIAANVVIGLVLGRLWSLGTPCAFIAGVYLVLSGLCRFVEESYRGEPQTPVCAGLRLYQWFAAASVLGGIGVSALASPAADGALHLGWWPVVLGLAVGAVYWFAMGVDFPGSERRFSRLA